MPASKQEMPTWLRPMSKPWTETRMNQRKAKGIRQAKTKNQIERDYLTHKYGWSNGYYEELLSRMTKEDEKMINSLYKADQHLAKLDKNRARIVLLEKPPITSVFQKKPAPGPSKAKDEAGPSKKAEKGAKKAEKGACKAKKNGPRCCATKMNGTKCDALLKGGKNFCGRHCKK